MDNGYIDLLLENIKLLKEIISIYEADNREKYIEINNDISNLESKIHDDYTYLGVIGDGSSGKSTLINSMINRVICPTDAIQGTTVTIDIIKKGNINDLEVEFADGTIRKYSESPKELISYIGLNSSIENKNKPKEKFLKKTFIRLKNILHPNAARDISNGKNLESMMELFKKISATQDIANNINKVTLYVVGDGIPEKVAIVDTPGIEYTNNKVSQLVYGEICDEIIVVIPSDEPVSESLINYINNNLNERKSDCIYVVTKLELQEEDKEEVSRLLKVIKKRIENGLSINSALVIPMPSLVYIAHKDQNFHSSIIKGIDDEYKIQLVEIYEEGINKIKTVLQEKRNRYIKQRTIGLYEKICEKLTNNLTELTDDYDKRNEILKGKSLPSADDFEIEIENNINDFVTVKKQTLLEDMEYLISDFIELKQEITEIINSCNDSQELMEQLSFSCGNAFVYCEQKLFDYVYEINEAINNLIFEVRKSFKEIYYECNVEIGTSNIEFCEDVFFTDDLVNGCEDLLQNKQTKIITSIQSDSVGIINAVMALFSNPFNKHRKMALSELYETLDFITNEVGVYIRNILNYKIDEMAVMANVILKKMLENNLENINDYILTINWSIEKNIEEKSLIENHIYKINELAKEVR